jgi:hypothetical protein
MQTKAELADFLRNSMLREVNISQIEMIEVFQKPIVLADDIDGFLHRYSMDFDASFSLGTLHWSFRRRGLGRRGWHKK